MILKDWTDEKAKAFGKETLSFAHDLHERPLFTDEGLAAMAPVVDQLGTAEGLPAHIRSVQARIERLGVDGG